jgi:alkyl hydroperoxide reductase subunit AhpF
MGRFPRSAPLLNLNAREEIMISPDRSTSYPVIFTAGGVTGAFSKRGLIVSGEGARAAPAARQYMLNVRKTVCPPS